MNLAVSQNEKLNINGIKNINDIDFQDAVYNTNPEKSVHLHGRKPLRIRFFANGDKFFPGKKISIHSYRYQNIDELMTELTNKMPPQVYLPNGIRQLFTSSSGRRIYEINQLETGHDYVCAGNENYKSIPYGKTEKDPWFKGRPHNFSRYPQLLPLGVGATNQNTDNNSNYKSDDQSHYAGQNAFPTRFYRPAGPTYLTKNVVSHFASHGSSIAYPKLIKFKSKASNNKNVNYYQDLLNQQVKPRVITVVRCGPEKPKGFVRILLNKRSVQSYETLLSDIEASLRDHSHEKMRGIGRIYNLLGKEIKSVGEFFRNDDFFIAVGENENLGMKQIKDILDDMYPDHPQTSQVLKYWMSKKFDDVSIKDDVRDQEKSKNIYGSSMSVDKRDSGFEEQNFSNDSEFNSFNNTNENNELFPLPKPKLSNSKPTIKKKKSIRKPPKNSVVVTNSTESETFMDIDKSTERVSPSNYQKFIQERNSERLRLAYEEREKARSQLQEQLKTERKKLEENVINNSSVYSQYVRKSINERGSIDVFKRMDEASQEARKQKIRDKIEKPTLHQLDSNNNSSVSASNVSSHINSVDQQDVRELPVIDSISHNNKIHTSVNIEPINNSPAKYKYSNHNVSPKLNKIYEDPSEYNNVDGRQTNDINEKKTPIEKIKKPKLDIEQKSNRKKIQRSSHENNENISDEIELTELSAVDNVQKVKISQTNDNDFNDSKEPNIADTQTQIIHDPSIENLEPEKKLNYEIKPMIISSVISVKDVQSQLSNIKTEDINNSENIVHNNPTEIIEKPSIIDESIALSDNTVSEKFIQRKLSLPGSRIMGKLCRQLSSPDIVYQRFEVSKVLGDGNFAVVKLAFHRKSKTEYALKIIDKARMQGKESMIENEIWIMKLCNHENIVKLKEEYETRVEVFLVMELVKGGDLFDAITENVKFSEPVAARMVSDMANALFYLHSRRIVHRDLKPENLMVLKHKDGTITLKLADFGLAMEIKKLIYTVCGTPTYVAPEILTEKGYSLEVDLWALGVISFILLCGFPPFRSPNRDQEQLFEIIKSGNFDFISPYWDKISLEVKDLIKRLLVVDRKLRSTTIDVLSHKWLMSRGKGTSISNETQKQRVVELEEVARVNLEGFQRQKKDLRATINKEIQAAYQMSQKNK